jgi:hypothetical protein
MGLDQYARVCEASALGEKQVDFSDDGIAAGEFFYWRKHPDLHGWMEKLYREKGGKEEFNCAPVRLNVRDLARLEADILNDMLPVTTGFFFGQSHPAHRNEDLEFIKKAREFLNEGMAVFYTSWW